MLQIEKRGIVIGDRSGGLGHASLAGAWSRSRGSKASSRSTAAVSNADLMMADGKSLEGVGVTPDELLLPTQRRHGRRRDPILSRAVTMLGGTLDPVAAGRLLGR